MQQEGDVAFEELYCTAFCLLDQVREGGYLVGKTTGNLSRLAVLCDSLRCRAYGTPYAVMAYHEV